MSKKEISIDADLLEEVIHDFKTIHGALAGAKGIFMDPSDDYWEQTGRLDAVEDVLTAQEEILQKSVERLCRLAGGLTV